MNVSFTRARSKLIIFGSRKTLQAASLLAEFFALMETQGWILRLPPNAHVMHVIPCIRGSSGKRAADALEKSASEKENVEVVRPQKKAKVKKPIVDEGLLRSRPILKDLYHGNK